MTRIASIRDLVNCWSSRAVMAADVNAAAGTQLVSVHQVHKWAEKQAIPAKYHWPVLQAARAKGFPITAELIVRLHDPTRDDGEVAA